MSLVPGTPAPLFTAPSPINPRFAFGAVGGRYVLLLFLPEPSPERDAALAAVHARLRLLDDERLLVFAVLPDAVSFQAAEQSENGVRWFHDPDGRIRRLYQAEDEAGRPRPQVVAIDPSLRILGARPLAATGGVLDRLAALGAPDAHAGTVLHAPVLIVPRVLEPEFCRRLIDDYHQAGGAPTGVMQERDGKTISVLSGMKRRKDADISDESLRQQLRARLVRRLLPEIEKAFQFRASHIERYIVACYDAQDGGHFHPHRDNTTPGTAHRRFAVSINLNAEEFEGGDLRFPEFGWRTYRPPTGGAVVFSCSLLHEATPVTRGRRYATLPFLYDQAGAEVRSANRPTFHESRDQKARVLN
jgi:predicted 2-oxoglutarate/Fe(II)-dependent dioxygenase YbiX